MDQKKSKNFSFAEEEELTNLVTKYWSVIQCKATDHVNNLKKKEYWAKIESEFNAVISEHYRPANVLKCKFENICRRAPPEKTENRQQLTVTGGGKADLAEYISPDKRVLALLGKRATGLPSRWCDDDDIANTNNEAEELVEEVFEFEEIGHGDQTEVDITLVNYQNDYTEAGTSWSKYTPGMLRQPKSSPLCFSKKTSNDETTDTGPTKRKKLYQDKMTLWAQEKASISAQEAHLKKKRSRS